MNEPKIIIKEKKDKNGQIICAITCVLIPALLVALIYEIRHMVCKRKSKACSEKQLLIDDEENL